MVRREEYLAWMLAVRSPGSQGSPGLSRREHQWKKILAGEGVYHTSRQPMADQVKAKGELQLRQWEVAHGPGPYYSVWNNRQMFLFSLKGWLPEPKGRTVNTKCTFTERPVQKGGWVSRSPSNTAGEHHDGSQSKHEQLWGDWTLTLERRGICSSDFEKITVLPFLTKPKTSCGQTLVTFSIAFSQINRGYGEAKALGNSSKGCSNPSFRNTQLANVNFSIQKLKKGTNGFKIHESQRSQRADPVTEKFCGSRNYS